MRRTYWLDVRCGPTSSSKTAIAIEMARREILAGRSVLACKASLNNERGKSRIVSKSGSVLEDIELIPASSPFLFKDVLHNFEDQTGGRPSLILVEEAQWFSPAMPGLLFSLRDAGYWIVVVGLDLDFRGEPYGSMPEYYSLANDVQKLHGVCYVCGEDATRSQRFINGVIAPWESPTNQEGGLEMYKPCCVKDFIVPPKMSAGASRNGKFEALLGHLVASE